MAKRQIIKTVRGYDLPEVVSALQKAIRRGDGKMAVYWAYEMQHSGYHAYLWDRLITILSEDVGLGAAPGMVADIHALHQHYEYLRGRKKDTKDLPLVHAIMLMAESVKSHAQLHVTMWAHWINHIERPEIPDWTFDAHTAKGRRMGRGHDYFVEVSGVIEPEDTSHDDPEARELWLQVYQHPEFDKSLGERVNPDVYAPLGKPLQRDLFAGTGGPLARRVRGDDDPDGTDEA